MGHKKHHKNHICSLDLGSDSMLPKKRPWSSLCRAVRKKWYVSELHPDAYKIFRSYPTLVAERQRQISEGGRFVVHPLSSCSLFWNSFMALVNLSHMILSTLRLSFVLHPLGHAPELHLVDHLLLALNLVCMVDILVKFHTGYVQGNANVVLNKLQIACHYLKSLFLVDLISSLPISYTLLFFEIDKPRYIFFGHLIAILKALTLCRDINNFITFLKTFHASYMVYGTVQNLILFILSAHWCSCINCLPVVSSYYWTGQCPYMYLDYLTRNSSDLPNIPMAYRYKKSIFVSVSAFFGTGFSMYKQYHPGEVFLHSLTILYAALFMVYILVYLIKVYITRHNSVIRYHELMNQLHNYMRHKQFPASLKKRVFAFYYYRYQGFYFREDIIFESLSEQLGNEIALHTCHNLVDKVSLFAGLPASVVGSVLGCLRPEVYLPNDLLVRAGDKGDCMYFIANGTVAVYSLKGVEVCHLEDGAHFGEVALLMKDSKRVATVVAVEITQVYRLDAAHFRHFIDTYQVLYERIEALASQRMHETVLLDEAFKREREKPQEHNVGSAQNVYPSPNPSAQSPK